MKTTYDAIDFNTLYKVQKMASSHKKKGSFSWDEKAEGMNLKAHRGIYNEFIQSKINLEGVKSLLDIGCGPGTFAIYYAPLVKEVVAFDFSEKMLEKVEKNAKEKGYKNVKIIKADIEDDWKDIPKCDVAIASRCLEVDDLKKALTNLNNHAKKFAILSFKAGNSYLSDELLKVLKIEPTPRPDYIYVLNVLYQMGIQAKLDFVPSEDSKCCKPATDIEDYVKSIAWSLEGLSEKEEKRAREYFLKCEKEGKEPAFRNNAWAVISWEK
ncbi:MAG: class I SAM-dependent methyltransferase [Campylobacteraceae bacterium]